MTGQVSGHDCAGVGLVSCQADDAYRRLLPGPGALFAAVARSAFDPVALNSSAAVVGRCGELDLDQVPSTRHRRDRRGSRHGYASLGRSRRRPDRSDAEHHEYANPHLPARRPCPRTRPGHGTPRHCRRTPLESVDPGRQSPHATDDTAVRAGYRGARRMRSVRVAPGEARSV